MYVIVFFFFFHQVTFFSCYSYLIFTVTAKKWFLQERFAVLIFSFPVWNLTADEEPRSISPAMRVMNCRAQRASAASEWRTATSAGVTIGPYAEVKTPGCPSKHWGSLNVTSIYISILRNLMVVCLPVSLLSFDAYAQSVFLFSPAIDSVFIIFFCCDWPDFDLCPSFFFFLLFSHAGTVMAISHVFFTSDHLWQAGKAVSLLVHYSLCSCSPQFQFSTSVNWINQTRLDFFF